MINAICTLGGKEGWPVGDALWQLRGLMDRMVGRIGMRRGRRHPRNLRVRSPVDFWRVEALEACQHLLRLRAEDETARAGPGCNLRCYPMPKESRVEQTAFFEPRGISGISTGISALPFHGFVSPGLIGALKRRAEAASEASSG